MALPRGATVVDFAYAIHSNVGDHTAAAKINGEQVPLRRAERTATVEIITAPVSTPNPAWLGFVRTGRAPFQDSPSPQDHGPGRIRTAGREAAGAGPQSRRNRATLPDEAAYQPLWDKLVRFTGNKNKAELLTDVDSGGALPASWPSAL
ncbi:MAG: TGS domain-containing protein [Burkholderiaceae bacterium]